MTDHKGRVDALQAAVMAAVKKEAAAYSRRNATPEGKPTTPPPAYLEKVVRRLVDPNALIEAFVADALEG